MKKTNKRNIVILIFLMIFIIILLRAFSNSRANKVIEITANIKDNSGLLVDEKTTLEAINEGESGFSITLPEVVNTKKVTKYIVTQKEMVENTEEETKSNLTNTTNETTNEIASDSKSNEETNIINVEQADTTNPQVIEKTSKVEKLPGEKIYLTQEERKNSSIILTVEYDKKEIKGETLYNKELVLEDKENDENKVDDTNIANKEDAIDEDSEDNEILFVSGYMPYDTELETAEVKIDRVKKEIEENYPDYLITENFDIKLMSQEKEYLVEEYDQTLDIEITMPNKDKTYTILEIQEDTAQEENVYENVKQEETEQNTTEETNIEQSDTIKELQDIKTEDNKLQFETNELYAYILLELQEPQNAIASQNNLATQDASQNGISLMAVEGENTTLNIDDYESDKNYYLGLNYTENMSQTSSGKYTESNLKELTINYYGYDYDLTEFVTPEKYDITLNATANRTSTGSVQQGGSGWNRYYIRTDTITCTVSGIQNLKDQYPEFNANSGWTMEMQVPNTNFSSYFNESETSSENSSNGINVNLSNGIMKVTGIDTSGLQGNSDSWTFTFYVSFRGNNRNTINNISYNNLSVNSFKTTITVGDEYTPYGTISDTEPQTLVSYRKCVPVDSNGNISIELIDNPFMNRPLEKGFNGWTTNNTKYKNTISTNSNTFVQTLNTNINNIRDSAGNLVIDLYPDWIDANVIFVSSMGSSSNSGTSPTNPVNNNWSVISSKLNANRKTCTNASDREVNIVVLMNGVLDGYDVMDPNTAFTLTSLYDGVNYGNTGTYLDVQDTNIQLDSDLQLDYLYISSGESYSASSYTTTDGTTATTPCIYGNMYNLRIGRGTIPTNSNNCTFTQVQGGYYNHSSSEYRVIVESGKYYSALLYRAGSGSNASSSTTANATFVIGSDIDRVKHNNENLKIYDRMASKTSSSTCSPYGNGKVVNTIIKSGRIGVDFFNNASTADDSDRNYAGIYVGGHGQTGYDKSDRYLLVEGGNIANIVGGLNVTEEDMYKTYMYIKGGNILNITGGAGYTHTYGDRIIQITDGYVKYSISGGSNGVAASSSSNNGQLTGESFIYVAGNAQIGASSTTDSNGNETVNITNTDEVLYGVNAGSVCGGANGNTRYAGQTDKSCIIIDGNAIVHNNVFGGGNYGIIGSSNIQGPDIIEFHDETSSFTENKEYLITTSSSGENGLVVSGNQLGNQYMSTATIPSDTSKWIFERESGNNYYIKNASTGQYIYVSSVSGFFTYTADIELSTRNKTAFTIQGSNTKTITYTYTTTGWFGGTYTLYLGYNNGWEITSGSNTRNLHFLTYTEVETEESPDLDTLVTIKVLGGSVNHNIYGGANQNHIYGTVDIDIENGNVKGIVYGGSNIRGDIYGSVLMDISGGQLGTKASTDGFDYFNTDVAFGGGLGEETNVNGRIVLNITDLKNNVHAYGNIYGGSSLGKVNNDITVNIQDLPTIANTVAINGYIFGGGEGDSDTPASVSGNVAVNVDGSNLENCSIFGGSNINGTITGTIDVNIGKTYESKILAVYGGGNQASITNETTKVHVYLLDYANVTNAFNGGKSADLVSSGKDDETRAIYLQGGTVQNLYGGSDLSGNVTASHVYIESGNATKIYGGNNQGGITEITNVIITGGNSQDVYGGGNQAICNETNVNVTGGTQARIYGGGDQAGVNTNTYVNLTNANIEDTIYGGGNQGTVTQNTYVHVKDSTIGNSVYAGGNGTSAVVYGNTNLVMEGQNEVTQNVFGGGNQAATGTETENNSTSTVNIVGAKIGGNVYGGANTSVVYGTTQTNIGYDTVGDTSLEIGDIEIIGTVFGGGEANASGSEIYDFSFISVTKGIDIQIDGNKHSEFKITGSIFGSGNASSTSGTSYINIQNYGTADDPQSNISIQRTDCVTISNSAISLSGATDRTNEYSDTFFSLSRVDQVKLKNNSTLYLCNGANLLEKLDSLVDVDGKEEVGKVTINPDTGKITEKNVDNRIYMLEGKNLNVATNEQATAYGQVHGMFFFGLFTNSMSPSTSTAFYHHSFENGDEITNEGTFSSNSYVMAQHMVDHNTTIDGFYTNYKDDGKIKVDYVGTTPEDDVYYLWVVGDAMNVTRFEVSLTASKYATLGTYELLLQGFSDPNLKMSVSGFSAGLEDGVTLVDPDEINTIEPDEEKANTVYGLTMRTGNVGWQTKGTTNFLTQNGGSYSGAIDYDKDNSSYTPTLNLCLYHSENITVEQPLGTATIRLQVLTPIDDLNYDVSYIDIVITLSTALYQNDFYEAAITPGQEYGLFTTTETSITSKSAFSAYYSLYVEDFSNSKYVNDYETYQRVLISRDSNNLPYVLPENTKITMLDMVTNTYYYYIVTNEDVRNGKFEYNLSDFLSMGSSDAKFNEKEASKQYYHSEEDVIYENFILHINFAESNLANDIQNNSLLMELRDTENETLVGVLGIQRDSMVYSVYKDKDATIKLDGNVSPETLYLGNTLNLNVITEFTQTIVDSKTIYDTQYFDQKLGIKISIYDINGNQLGLDSLFGVNFELDGNLYYPRVDGTTRICIADKVTNVLAKLKMNTIDNTTLATGDYKIQIESFGSPDGIYYGLTASDKIELDVRIINSAFGLKVVNKDSNKIIDKETGVNESNGTTLESVVEYSSKLSNPNIAVSLYRRDYDEEYAQTYTLVDLQEFVSNNLTATAREKEYEVSTSPTEIITNHFIFKQKLMTGTYKLVYTLYDGDVYVGEAFDYLVIK